MSKPKSHGVDDPSFGSEHDFYPDGPYIPVEELSINNIYYIGKDGRDYTSLEALAAADAAWLDRTYGRIMEPLHKNYLNLHRQKPDSRELGIIYTFNKSSPPQIINIEPGLENLDLYGVLRANFDTESREQIKHVVVDSKQQRTAEPEVEAVEPNVVPCPVPDEDEEVIVLRGPEECAPTVLECPEPGGDQEVQLAQEPKKVGPVTLPEPPSRLKM